MTWWNNGDWEGAPINRLYTIFSDLLAACRERYTGSGLPYPLTSYFTLPNGSTISAQDCSPGDFVGMSLESFVRLNFPVMAGLVKGLVYHSSLSTFYFYVNAPDETLTEAYDALLLNTSYPDEWLTPEYISDVRPWIQLKQVVSQITKYFLRKLPTDPSGNPYSQGWVKAHYYAFKQTEDLGYDAGPPEYYYTYSDAWDETRAQDEEESSWPEIVTQLINNGYIRNLYYGWHLYKSIGGGVGAHCWGIGFREIRYVCDYSANKGAVTSARPRWAVRFKNNTSLTPLKEEMDFTWTLGCGGLEYTQIFHIDAASSLTFYGSDMAGAITSGAVNTLAQEYMDMPASCPWEDPDPGDTAETHIGARLDYIDTLLRLRAGSELQYY